MSVESSRINLVTRCKACGYRFAWVNLVANIALAGGKATVGVLAGSEALLVSSLYSVNDILSAAAVLASLRVANRPADEMHPFGYGKAEFIAVGMVSLVLVTSVCFFVYAVVGIMHGSEGPPSAIAALVALVSLCTSEFLARRGFCLSKNLGSPALRTAAEHNRADALASGAVLIGIAGALMGVHVLDRIVAAFEAIDLMRLGGGLLGQSVKGLMDSSLPPDQVDRLRRDCASVPGVLAVHTVRTRRAGAQAWVDMIVTVAEHHSVEEAHAVTRQVRKVVREALGPQTRTQIAFRAASGVVESAGAHA